MEQFDFEFFSQKIEQIKSEHSNDARFECMVELFNCKGLGCHFTNKKTNRSVFSVYGKFEYDHECTTAKKLTAYDYDVLFLPKGYFERNEKNFDVFLCRDHIMLEADLKRITSTNPDTIGKVIKRGSHQAKRLVIDIQSDIKAKKLIEGLKTGCERNDLLKEVMLLYSGNFFRLPVTQILSKTIFNIIK